MQLLLTSAKILALAALCFAFMGCQGQKENINVKEPEAQKQSCSVPETLLLDKAFEESRQTLSHPDCFHQFNDHFHALLDIALQNPKPANGDKFHDYLVWAQNQGIISSNKAREYWGSYFTTTFVSLPDDYRVSDYCSQKEDLLSDLQDELEKKKQGFTAKRDPQAKNSSGQPDKYLQAAQKYNKIELVFTAACKACEMQ